MAVWPLNSVVLVRLQTHDPPQDQSFNKLQGPWTPDQKAEVSEPAMAST